MSALSETRKADRAIMARQVIDLATGHGCKADVDEVLSDGRETWVRIEAPGGLQLTIDFSSKSWQPNTYVLSWHMALDSTRLLSPDYWPSINTVHFCKATDIAKGFADLIALLDRRLADAASGAVYQQAPPISNEIPS